jgi:hypothetical protein
MLVVNADELPRFMACNGVRLMGGNLPPINGDNTVRDEGTAAHYLATSVMCGRYAIEELIDRKAPNGVFITAEMAEHVIEYIDVIGGRPPDRLAHEVEIDTSFSDNATFNVPARCDSLTRTTDTLFIDDFKYGWRIVEPTMNWTLIAHAIGYLSRSVERHGTPYEVVFTIHQPRPYHPEGATRSWSIKYDELKLLWANLVTTLSNPANDLRTSEHCGKCRALTVCPAARKAEMNAIDVSEIAFEDTVDNNELAFNLDTLHRAQSMLKSAVDAYEELAKHRIKQGQIVENYGVESGIGNSRWKEGIDAATLRILTGKELSSPKLVTPAEAKRLGVPDAVVKSLTERPPTGPKLVRANANKRAERLLKKG